MGSLGLPEMALILGIVVLLFGGKKLPEIGQALGESIKNFKKGIADDKPAITSQPPPGANAQPKRDDRPL